MHNHIFPVKNKRARFKCPACEAKRLLPVPPGTRHKTIKCHRCGIPTKCLLDRRLQPRQMQTGKATMILPDRKEIPIELLDISSDGIGCMLERRETAGLNPFDEVRFSCDWDHEALFHHGKYIVRSIQGNRIGVENAFRSTITF